MGDAPKIGTFGTSPLLGKQADAWAQTWETITLSLPGDTEMPVPAGRWERRDERIIATYTREELAWAMGLMLEMERCRLEARLERGLEMLEATTGDDARAEHLLKHWDTLNEEYAQVRETLRVAARDL